MNIKLFITLVIFFSSVMTNAAGINRAHNLLNRISTEHNMSEKDQERFYKALDIIERNLTNNSERIFGSKAT